ncbi:MAG: PAS domain-containing protein [Rhizobiaceae bacterium]
MRRDKTIELFHYWNRLRNGRPAPERTEIEPADIKTLLADTFILERDSRSKPVFRLAGTQICAIFARELKGFAFDSLWSDRDASMARKLAEDTFGNNSVIVITFEGRSASDRNLEFELILLPLVGGQDNQRALGAIVPSKRPFWLGVDAIETCFITSVRIVDPEREPMFLKNRPAVPVPPMAGLDSLQPGNSGPAESMRRVQHLVVLNGGRSD